MNLTVNTVPAAGWAAGASAASSVRPLTGFAAATVADSFSTAAAVAGQSIQIPVSVNRRAQEAYARATSVPMAVDPTASSTSATAVSTDKAKRGKLAAASQRDR